MAKIAGISGSLAGKVGNIVYSVLKGVNIARQYNPAPFNPSTPAQIESRAKLKLISQLSAIVANQLAIVRKATESARNVFTKINYAYLSYADGAASMNLADMQLTSGYLGFPGFTVERVAGYGLSVALTQAAFPAFDKVVWVVYRVLEDGKLMFNESKVVELTAELPLGATIMQNVAADCTIHCYGISTKSAKAFAAFENLVVVTADEVARLISTRTLSDSDVTLSETRGLYLKANEDASATSGAAIQVSLGFTANSFVDDAPLQGSGSYPYGSEVTIVAPAVEGAVFRNWYKKVGNNFEFASSDASYTFAVGSRPVLMLAFYEQAQ